MTESIDYAELVKRLDADGEDIYDGAVQGVEYVTRPLSAAAARAIEALVRERDALREILSGCAAAAGGYASPDCSIEFMSLIPDEFTLKCGREREAATAKGREAGIREAAITYRRAQWGRFVDGPDQVEKAILALIDKPQGE